MTIVKCHECGNDVSTEAKTCPSCGVKVKKPTSRTTIVLGSLLAFSFGAAILDTQHATTTRQTAEAERLAALTPEQRSAEEAAKAAREIQLQRAIAGAMMLKKSMKDPRAFELTQLTVMPDGTACYDFRGKNSFGATFPTAAVITTKGKLLTQERDKNAFVNAWNAACTRSGGTNITALAQDRLAD